MSSHLLHQARTAIQAGQAETARRLLEQAIEQDAGNHAAWLLLASVATTPHIALAYVQRAARLRPHDPTVQKALAWAQARVQAAGQPQSKTATAVSPPRPTRSHLRPVLALLLLLLLVVTGFYGRMLLPSNSGLAAPAKMAAAVPPPQETATETPPAPTATVVTAVALSPTPTTTPFHLRAKNVARDAAHDPRPTWTLTPTPTDTPVPTPTLAPTATAEPAPAAAPAARPAGVGPGERWIDINLTAQTLVAYEGDTPVLSVLISSGTWRTPTVTGQFRTYIKHESQTMNGYALGYNYYLENVPYVMYFYRGYAIHGTYWHNNFGAPMSHGCVNVNTADAGWLFNWAPLGTLVNVRY